jgi:hypothetical protein
MAKTLAYGILYCLKAPEVMQKVRTMYMPLFEVPVIVPYENEIAGSLQRQNAENLKQIFPEKEYRGLSPNFLIHVSASELYIPTMGLPALLEEICRLILGIYKSLKDT